jgi:proteasome component ECM29
MFGEVYDIVAPVLEDFASEDKMDTTDDTKSGGKSDEAATLTAGVSALYRAVNFKYLDPSPLIHLPKLLETMKTVLPSSKVTIATRLNLYERTKVLFDGFCKRTHPQGSSHYELALGFFTILELPSGSGSEVMRTKRGEAAEMIVQALVGGVFGMSQDGRQACRNQMSALVVEGRKHERSPTVQAVLDKVLNALGDK